MKTPPSNQENNSNVVDLSDILGQGTEKKNPGAPPVVNPEENNQAGETQPAPEGNEEVINENESIFFDSKPEVKEEKKPEIKIDYIDQAKTMVMTLDTASQITLPMVYRRRMFTKDEREQLKEIKDYWRSWKNNKLKEDALSDQELKLIRLYDEYKEIVDAIDFSEKEIEMLSNPLALMLQKYNMQSGPEASFIFAIVTVMGPRIMPLFIRD